MASLFNPLPTETLELPNAQLVINHALKTVFMSVPMEDAKEANWRELEAHFKQRGYFLQVIGLTEIPAINHKPG